MTLVAQLRSCGVRLRVDEAALRVAPRSALTDGDRAAIRQNLVELKALVQAEADMALVATVFGEGVRG
jgi:hypothetical protein